ncbi:S41 family peptidase [Marinicella sp. S1101]|uniref:S41 family peptidase n=1 Tax=Marinicella marina TaxID=2996016 RepID=UPI002260A052|nr:S41 family peptidase [Marinicella marina]MCX7553649.1 S41 family peptidase [Marinicella marina]MDJ1140273.1 S41 family peptidase [Marinicella marina]
MRKIILLSVLFLMFGCATSQKSEPELKPTTTKNLPQQLSQEEALAAFAKLYGFARYFHPTHEAMEVDWDKFLIYGVEQIKMSDTTELVKTLNQIFEPIADGMIVYHNHLKPNIQVPQPMPNQQLKMWQHLGLGDDSLAHYASNRLGDIPETHNNAIFTYLAGDNFKGKYYKLTAKVKVENTGPKLGGRLILSAYDGRGTEVTNDYKNLPLIDDFGWRTQRVTGKLGQSTAYIMLGAELIGPGQIWTDDYEMQLSTDGESWEQVKIPNHQFDQSDNELPAAKWRSMNEDFYSYEVINDAGNNVMKITAKGQPIAGQVLPLEKYQYTTKELALNEHLSVHLPITVWEGPENYISASFIKLQEILSAIDTPNLSADSEIVRLANVIKLWNVIQHYYPYFDVVDTNWEDLLIPALKQASYDQSPNQHYLALAQVMAQTKDGHGIIYFRSEPVFTGVPLKVLMIEDQLVVVGSQIDNIFKGDVITVVNGMDVKDYVADQMTYVAGSPHLTELRTLNQFGYGVAGTTIDLQLKRGPIEFNHTHTRDGVDASTTNMFHNRLDYYDFPDIEELKPGIFYVNLATTTKQDFKDHKTKLAQAKGIVFDKRWDGKQPKSQITLSAIRDLLPHLITAEVSSPTWLTPVYTQPNQAAMQFKESSWNISPAEPYFTGKKVFINTPAVVSQGETFTSFIDHYELGELVGENTAGCNGNANFINLFGGYRAMFTGMKVIKHDQSQLHLIGFEPDHPVKRTLSGIINKEDELLNKALAVLENDH